MVVRLFCILFFISNLVKSQDYPILSLDTNGTKLVIFTEPQAQKIDSMLSELNVCNEYKKLIDLQNKESIIFTTSDSLCSSMISNKDSVIFKKDNIIASKDSIIETKKDKIGNLNSQIENYEKIVGLSDKEISNKNEEIKIKNKEIIKWKFRAIGSWLVTGGILVLIIL